MTDLLARTFDETGIPLEHRVWLNEQYHERSRHYHDIGHIWDLLNKIDRLSTKWCPEDWRAPLFRVAWFHDCVYGANPGVDELASAEQMIERLGYSELHPEVKAVLDTAGHFAPSSDMSALFLDLDLSRLAAAEYGDFVLDSEKIRAEYHRLGLETWLKGRRDFMVDLMNRHAIYHTDYGKLAWESQARFNLLKAIRWYEESLRILL
jgi:predicted metal-dependent HD superfamily phosphohydrolase